MWYDLLKTPRAQITIASVVSLIVGGTVVHVVDAKRLEAKYADLAEQEIADAKRFYGELSTRSGMSDKPGSPTDLVALLHPEESSEPSVVAAADALLKYQGFHQKDPLVRTNIFTDKEFVDQDPDETIIVSEVEIVDGEVVAADVVVYNNEDSAIPMSVVHKDREEPYIISEEIWQAGEMGYDQPQVTYYAGDDVLADENDQLIDNVEQVVGTDNLLRFGEGTDNENGLFIRNNKLKLDLEVQRSDGSYKFEVLGLEHSDDRRQHNRPGVRKFRDQDE